MIIKKHPYAKILTWIANGLQVQLYLGGKGWTDITPNKTLELISKDWGSSFFRLKKNTHFINGVECPAPETEPPPLNSIYWVASPISVDMALSFTWIGYKSCQTLLDKGLVHLTKEAAEENAKAMLAFKKEK